MVTIHLPTQLPQTWWVLIFDSGLLCTKATPLIPLSMGISTLITDTPHQAMSRHLTVTEGLFKSHLTPFKDHKIKDTP